MAGFDITEGPTFDLRGLGASATYVPSGRAWDCSIGGLPFLFATSQQFPYRRGTADWRRSRYDSGVDYGEQSLDTGYWTRNQLSFHYGAGQRYAEALESNPDVTRFRFYSGGSVDPWTPGAVSATASWSAYTGSAGANPLLEADGAGNVLYADSTALKTATTGAWSSVTWGGTGSILSLCTDGTSYFAADSTGIYKGTMPSGAGSLIWNTGSSNVCARFVKQRLIAGIGASIYELTGTGPTLPSPLYTHPNSSWVWTDIVEGPNSIYLAGYAGGNSAIYRITVTATSTTITLGAPIVVAEVPRNELVYTLYSYLGTFLGVGTSKGLRVAEINTDGSITMSPVQFPVTGGVRDMVGSDAYLYVAGGSDTPVGDGTFAPGLYRVSLSTQTSDGVYAWSPETAFAVSGSVNSVAVRSDGGLVAAVASATSGVWRQLTDGSRATEGWVVLPVIRLGTAEGKVFREVQVRGVTPSSSKIEAYASTTGSGSPSSWTLLGALGAGQDGFLSLETAAAGPQETLYLAFKLVGADASNTPTLYGYRLRALPTVARKSRLLEVPLMCFDEETDRLGNKLGKRGGAWERLSALEDLEDSGEVVMWQDFTSGEARMAQIEKVSAIRMVAPSRSEKNASGIVSVSLRLL